MKKDKPIKKVKPDAHKEFVEQTLFRNETSKLREINKKLLQDIDLSHKRERLLLDLKEHQVQDVKIEETKGVTSEAISTFLFSDLHLEERVDSDTVNGMNHYTVDEAVRRSRNYFVNAVRLNTIFSRDVTIKKGVLALLGDNITGYIHDELEESNYLSPTQATLKAYDILVSGINYMLDNTKLELTVICKIGNHGRTTVKRRISTGYKNSYEWMMYHFIKCHFAGNDRLNIVVDNSYHTYVDYFGRYTGRFHHGDDIKYQGGIGGIAIPANKAIHEWNSIRRADFDCFGHYHQQMKDARTFTCNGSIIGYNAYAISIKAPYEVPRQTMFLVDKKRGKSVEASIDVL